jgi:hypothetical protein
MGEEVAVVLGAAEGLGRSVALVLAAGGAKVVVVGPDERRVAEVVGDAPAGGGVVRHAVGGSGGDGVLAGAERAQAAFGRVDWVVASDLRDVSAFGDAVRALTCGVLVIGREEQAVREGLATLPPGRTRAGLVWATDEDGRFGELRDAVARALGAASDVAGTSPVVLGGAPSPKG